MNPELIKELTEIRDRLFNLANSQAGDDKGNAASYLHASCNEVTRAIKCLERGNPASDPIPFRFIAASMGLGPTD
jgi:hypothetical protein